MSLWKEAALIVALIMDTYYDSCHADTFRTLRAEHHVDGLCRMAAALRLLLALAVGNAYVMVAALAGATTLVTENTTAGCCVGLAGVVALPMVLLPPVARHAIKPWDHG